MKDKNNKDDRFELSLPINRRTFKYAALLVLLVAGVYIFLFSPQKIIGIFTTVIKVLTPFIIGGCLAYIVNIIMRPLERGWVWCWRKAKNQKAVHKAKRPVCLTVSFLLILGVIFSIIFMIIPALEETVVNFATKIPQYAQTVEGWYHNIADFASKYNVNIPQNISLNTDKLTDIAKTVISDYGESVIDTTVNVTTSIVTALFDIVLGIVFAVYMLAQKEKLSAQIKKATFAVFKAKRAERIVSLTALANRVFTKFVTGQFTEACIIGILSFIGMMIFGMPYAGIISLLIGFTALIPIFGAFIGTAIGAFLILLENPIMALWFVVFIIVLQQLEGNLIYPRVVGKSVGLPGIWVLAAVTFGGGFFGLFGMLFSVPICSILYVLFRNYVNKKTKNISVQVIVTEADEQTKE